jgi:phosphoenolpyruvate phosphomutase / 2-hydroxyethylphosphonate cytidylyltransferase
MNKKKVYLGLTVDTIHHGHINLIKKASELGDVTIGLLTDKAVANHKRMPILNYKQRKIIIENIVGVKKVIAQEQWDYSLTVKKYKPDFVVHGDDWLFGPEMNLRKKVLKELKKYGGKLIEIPHTKGVSSSAIAASQAQIGITPDLRLKSLKRLIHSKKLSRFIETHSPISAMIAEKISYKKKDKTESFDGFWSSSLTDSTNLCKPDNESLDISERLSTINKIFEPTSKPLIMDIDTGGKTEHLKLNIKSIERLGISAVIMEDKTGLKKNSLFGTKVNQKQDSIKKFSEKISVIKNNQINSDFMVIARVESLILNKGMKDALKRAYAYVAAGADGIMIHSKSNSPKEIFEFSKKFRKNFKDIPLICVPTSYNSVKESDLIKNNFNVVIYANHLFRASYPAMMKTALSILKNSRSKETDKNLISISKILELIPGTK